MESWYPTPPTSTTADPGCLSTSVPHRRAIMECPPSPVGQAGERAPLLDLRLKPAGVGLSRVELQGLTQHVQRLLAPAVDVERVGQAVVEERHAHPQALRLLHQLPGRFDVVAHPVSHDQVRPRLHVSRLLLESPAEDRGGIVQASLLQVERTQVGHGSYEIGGGLERLLELAPGTLQVPFPPEHE